MSVTITNLVDKSHKLSVNNVHKRDTRNALRIPCYPDDPSCAGGTLLRYKEKCAPDGYRWYCKPATLLQKLNYAKTGHPNVQVSPNTVIGQNPIGKMVKKACERVGLDCSGQGLRRLALTTVANTKGINKEAKLRFGRHNSVSAQREYRMIGADDEMAKFESMGVLRGGKTEE